MQKTIIIDGKDYDLPCGSLSAFKRSLSNLVNLEESWQGKELLFKHKADVLKQLEDKECWTVASELLEMTPREYVFYAVDKKLWGGVRYFLEWASLSEADVAKLLSLGLPDDIQRDLRRLKVSGQSPQIG